MLEKVKIKTRRMTVIIREDQYDTLLEIRDVLQLMDVSEVVRTLLSDGKSKYLENYRRIAKMRIDNTDQNREGNARKLVENAQMKEDIKKERFLAGRTRLCESVGGEVRDGMCFYPTWNEVVGGKVEERIESVPIELLKDDVETFQYRTFSGTNVIENQRIIRELLAK